MSASDLSVLDFDVTMPKCAVCGADTGFLHNKLCTQCTADGLLWAARQARTPDQCSQVDKLTPKAGDLIVLRYQERFFEDENLSIILGKLAERFPGVTFLVMPLESSVESTAFDRLATRVDGTVNEVEKAAMQAGARALNHAAIQATTAKVAGTSPQVTVDAPTAYADYIEELKAMTPEQLRAGVQEMIEEAKGMPESGGNRRGLL